MKSLITIAALVTLVYLSPLQVAVAHDTWLQTNTSIVRPGDAIFIDLMLGNHGNDHRDFKVAGKASLENSTIQVIGPDGKSFDITSSMDDVGYTPKEGFWTTTFEPGVAGLYMIAQSSDQIASYAPERIVRSAKTFFLASKSLDRVAPDAPGFDRVLGQPLELVPLVNPIAPMGPGVAIKVKLLFRGKPLAAARISFIPRGQTLANGFDPTYERMTDGSGIASFEPKEANYYLIVAHREEPDEKGKGYNSTKYGATLTVIVPAICPCCGE